MESVEQGDVEASYLLGFLDDYEGLDYETVMGYDDYECRGRLKKEVSQNSLDLGLGALHSNIKESSQLLGNELLQIVSHTTNFCKKERSLDSSPRKRTPCTIGCKSLDDLELISRRGSLRSQFAVTCEDFTGGKSSKTNVDDGVNTHETLIKVKETLDKKKQRKWLPLKTNRAYLLRPVCSETRRGKLCTKGLNHSCTTETMQTILDSTSFNTGEANFISIDDKVSDKNKDISLIRGKFSSATNLPTYIKSGVQLGNFPGDSKNAFKRKTIRRNAVPTVEYEPDIYYDSDDSSKVSDLPEDDLERGSAIVAAFVVTLITIWFFGTMISMIFITMSVSGDYQGRIITYNLCKNFPDWSGIIVNDSSWCDPKIFNYHFQLSVQCPCFSPDHNPYLNTSLDLHYTLPPPMLGG